MGNHFPLGLFKICHHLKFLVHSAPKSFSGPPRSARRELSRSRGKQWPPGVPPVSGLVTDAVLVRAALRGLADPGHRRDCERGLSTHTCLPASQRVVHRAPVHRAVSP